MPAFFRQDPDVVLIGDLETRKLPTWRQAAPDGRLVLASSMRRTGVWLSFVTVISLPRR